MPPGVVIGEGRYCQGRCVRTHVETVGEKSHGTEEKSRKDLNNHHDGSYDNDDKSFSFPIRRLVLSENVIVDPAIDRFDVQFRISLPPRSIGVSVLILEAYTDSSVSEHFGTENKSLLNTKICNRLLCNVQD